MSTDERTPGDEIPTTDAPSDDGIGTPAASISTKATPSEIGTTVEAHDGIITVALFSEQIEGSLMFEAEPARQLRDDLDAALDELGATTEEGTEQ